MLAAYHKNAPGNVYNITNDRPLTQQEMFDAIADAVGGTRPTRHLPYLPIYYGSIVAEKVVARVTRTKPIVTQLGALMFGSDNKHSVEKARRELGYRATGRPAHRHQAGRRMVQRWWHERSGHHPGQPERSPGRSHALNNNSGAQNDLPTRETRAGTSPAPTLYGLASCLVQGRGRACPRPGRLAVTLPNYSAVVETFFPAPLKPNFLMVVRSQLTVGPSSMFLLVSTRNVAD